MNFQSTVNPGHIVPFREALFNGLAPDGGLYVPVEMPNLSALFESLPQDVPFKTLAQRVMAALLAPEIDENTTRQICNEAFNFQPVIQEVKPGMNVLELFHGPSCAFKDFGAAFLAASMNTFLKDTNRKAVILTATSGDTGSAVAQAFHGKSHVDVVILYPSGRVSPLQEKQLTTLGGNITALEIQGSFDDCQRMVKAAFTHPGLKSIPLTSANSINIGRLFPQALYYIWAWTRKKRFADHFTFVVPSGNFGNITAGLYTASWGLPVQHFVAATNANRIVPDYLETGEYRPRPSLPTYSNAMDVGNPSNFERLSALYHNSAEIFRNHVQADFVDDKTTLETINRVFQEYGYLCCPHTAVGWSVAERYREKNPESQCLVLATAHPGKFVETVMKASGETPTLPEALRSLQNKEKHAVEMDNEDRSLRNWLLSRF